MVHSDSRRSNYIIYYIVILLEREREREREREGERERHSKSQDSVLNRLKRVREMHQKQAQYQSKIASPKSVRMSLYLKTTCSLLKTDRRLLSVTNLCEVRERISHEIFSPSPQSPL